MDNSNDLLKNIEKIHTTELGIIRIKRNLELDTKDIINWCKMKIKQQIIYTKKEKIGTFLSIIAP